jgi:ABC-2 type transport system permease protein
MSTLTTTPTRTSAPATWSRLVAYARLDLRRQFRDKLAMFFTIGLPAFMYLVFGLGSDDAIGSGNLSTYVMISMAAYGAVGATTGTAGSAVTELVMGWGRQLSLTPIRPLQVVALKSGIAMTVAAVPIALIYAIGAVTGARGDLGDWLGSALIVWVFSSMFAIYGLAIATFFRTQSAIGVASGSIVVMAFLGNVFSPMSGLLLDIGRFTPLYGYAALARYPLTDGWLPSGEHDPLWLPIANVITWTIIFSALAVLGVRRGRERV